MKDFEVSTWYGLFAPRATPAAPLDAIHAAVQAALPSRHQARLGGAGARIDLESRQAFGDFVKAEVERWSAIARPPGCRWSSAFVFSPPLRGERCLI